MLIPILNFVNLLLLKLISLNKLLFVNNYDNVKFLIELSTYYLLLQSVFNDGLKTLIILLFFKSKLLLILILFNSKVV